MKIIKQKYKRHGWLKKSLCMPNVKHWLEDEGSLTARLKACYADFAVQPVMLQYAKALRDETGMLGLKQHEYALIREVLLIGDSRPVVFAHSVLPRASLRGSWRGLGKLGNKPLGAALFANPKVKRTPLEYKKLSACSPIFMRLSGHVKNPPKVLWARRSVFSLNCAKILVTEVFLDELFK
jgi:chorismate--pyruvate lyase